MIFDHCKWDPQAEDVSVLAPFALVLNPDTWRQLRTWAESLAGETIAMEKELISRPDLRKQLALPRAIVRCIRGIASPPSGIARVMRFDFHFTTQGWRISEVNSDVPGGFIEASALPALMASAWASQQFTPAGDPAAALADAIAREVGDETLVAMVHATAYTDDRQVMIYLARSLAQRGIRTVLSGPHQFRWDGGCAHAIGHGKVDAILRFFPAEWLPNLGRRVHWQGFFGAGLTPQCNPATALITQSKRLPLVWDHLQCSSAHWRKLLPETRHPRGTEVRSDEWVLKPAMGRVGDGIGMHGVTSRKEWKSIRGSLRWFGRRNWVAQRRFRSVPVATPDGDQHACIGVYTIDGKAAGIYGRISAFPLIDHRARDVAVLVPDNAIDVPGIERRAPAHVR
jgi:glutathionylspermidine synthase